jgi:PTS system nitrogen regulatory IIA component
MTIADILAEECVAPSLRAGNKAQLLQELSRRAAMALNLPQAHILNALEAREKLGSTGLGQGFALPHARVAGLVRFFGLFAKLVRPVAYEAIDEKPVDLVFLLLMPGAGDDHVKILAAISRCIRDPEIARRLRGGGDAAALYGLLTGS